MGRREQRKESQRKRWSQIAIGLLLVVLMVASILQASFNSTSTTPQYGGIKFEPGTDGYRAEIDRTTRTFHNVPLEGDARQLILQSAFGPQIFLYADEASAQALQQSSYFAVRFNPDTQQPDIQFIELARLELLMQLGIPSGLTNESETYPTLSVLPCDTSMSGDFPVLELLASNESISTVNITAEGSCITAKGDGYGLLAVKDYLILLRSGVIPIG